MGDMAHIAARWRYWEPLEVIASLQRRVPRIQYMVAARRRHEEAAMACRIAEMLPEASGWGRVMWYPSHERP